MRGWLLASMAAGFVVLAAAPDRPALTPAREASVLYRVTNADAAPIEVRVTTAAGGSPLRLDMPDHSYMLVNASAHTMSMVVPDEQMVLNLPYQDGPQTHFQLNDRMQFIRRAPATVASVRCTTWDVAVDNARGTMCISDDGIMLRSLGVDETGRRNVIEAVSVSYAPATANEFVPPADFSQMAATADGLVPAKPSQALPSQALPP